MKNNILIITPSLKKGGTETQLKILIDKLISLGYNLTVAIRKNNFDLRDLKDINLIELEDKSFISVKSLYRLYVFIRKEKPLFVYSLLRQMNVMTGFLNYFYKFNWVSSERSNPYFDKSIYSKFERFLKKKSLVICNSKYSEKFYRINNYSTFYLPNFLKYEPQTIVSYDRTFIVLSRLVKSKKIDVIIKAWSKFNTNSELIIVGDGPEKENLKLLSKSLFQNNINFYGNIAEPKSLLLSSSFYISASIFEGMPNATLEALCCNNILILSDIDVHREILNSNLEYLFKPNSVDELVVILNKVINLSKTDFEGELNQQKKFLDNLSNNKIMNDFFVQIKTFFEI